MQLKRIQIRRIEKLNDKARVFDLSVENNHNFFIGNTQTLTHNCDYLTPNAQAALRNIMETFSKTTRFILTCNYVDKIIDPIQSRCQIFNIVPPSRKDIAIHLVSILDNENVSYTNEDLVTIVNSSYPDIRRVINTAQRCIIDNKLMLDKSTLVEQNYYNSIVEVLKSKKDKKTKFTEIRQILSDNSVKDYVPLFRYLYDNVELYAQNTISSVILIIAEAQYKDALVVDHEINAMSMFIQILIEIDKKTIL